jgi:hypothetical protein
MMLAARVTTLLLISATVLILLYILVTRMRITAMTRAKEKLLKQWRPLIMESAAGMPVTPPPISPFGAIPILYLWNSFHDKLKGESIAKLNMFAHRVGLDKIAVGIMKKGNMKNRLLAMHTFGNLRQKEMWDELGKMSVSNHPVLSLAAARALIAIDPAEAAKSIIPLIVQRRIWSPAIIATLLRQMGADIISQPLTELLKNVGIKDMPRVIRYLEAAHYKVTRPIVQQLLSTSTNDEVISACLQVIQDRGDLDIVREHLRHPKWFVRLQALRTLRKIGTGHDVERLLDLLRDPNWWVRYRAAQALAEMPLMNRDRLINIMENETDRYARDIIKHVLAENGKASN